MSSVLGLGFEVFREVNQRVILPEEWLEASAAQAFSRVHQQGLCECASRQQGCTSFRVHAASVVGA